MAECLQYGKTSIARNYDYLFKVIVIGDSGVGKTSFLSRFTGDEVLQTHISTIGIDFKMKQLEIDGKRVKVQVWDTAGQERYETITTQYYRRAQGIVLVYDISNMNSFVSLRKWIKYVGEFAQRGVSISLVGNKNDLHEQWKVSQEEAAELAREFNVPWFETSAYTGENVDSAFITVAKAIYVEALEAERLHEEKESFGCVVISEVDAHERSHRMDDTKCCFKS